MDINGDGIIDIISGSYMGELFFYEGTEKEGFKSTQTIYQDSIPQFTTRETQHLFNRVCFTNPTFGDFNNDGLQDMFLCGLEGIRVVINKGTAEKPIYRDRQPLLDVNGNQVSHVLLSAAEIESLKKENNGFITTDYKSFIVFIDWDGDGIKDLITTSSYEYPSFNAISFHRGVKIGDELRFELPVPLFTAKDGGKALPGTNLIPYIADINNDGILDIVIGVTMPVNMDTNEFDLDLAHSFRADDKKKESIQELEDRRIKNYGYIIVLTGKRRY